MEFVDRHLDSFVKWDVLVYFHENQEIEKKVSGLALDIGRKVSSLEPVLEGLAAQGILESEEEPGDERSYRYSATSEFKLGMEKFSEATRDRANRLAFVSKVLQKEAGRL